jgi:hypothetical protein
MPCDNGRRSGAALLDVLVAATVLATAGVALVGHAAELSSALASREAREMEVWRAASLLTSLAILRPVELRARVGIHVEAGFRLQVMESHPGLFSVRVLAFDSEALVLETMLYPASGSIDVPR